MSKPLADYVQLPKLDEYKEWFKDFADLYREDGILQVTWKTLNGPMQHSGMSHRAISQLTRWLSMDLSLIHIFKNVRSVRAASLDELMEAVPKNTALAVYRHFHPEDGG